MRTADKVILKKLSRLVTHFRGLDLRYSLVKLPLASFRHISEIPVTSREDLERFSKTVGLRDVVNVTATSGTTETRLLIGHSRESYSTHVHRLVTLYRSIGISSKDLCLNLCSYGLNSGGRIMETAYKAAGAGVIPLGVLDNEEKIAEAATLVRALKPTVVNSYTNQLFQLFSLLGRNHSVRRCVVNGEPLFLSFKKQIEKMAGVSIFDHYGAMEFSGFAIAQKSDDAYLRVFDEGLWFEILGDDGRISPTGRGALLVTDLENMCMPFIRYRLGDRVELVRRRGALWIKVLGRLSDTLLIDGEVCSCLELIRDFQEAIGHPHFFIFLEKDMSTYRDRLVVNVPPQDAKRSAEILRGLACQGEPVRLVTVRSYRGEMPRTSTGKLRHIIDARKKSAHS